MKQSTKSSASRQSTAPSLDGPHLAVFDPEASACPQADAPAKPPARKSKLAAKHKAKPKPTPDLPLWQRQDGRWCRKIKGRVHYFGIDKDVALQEWERTKSDLLAGRTPREKTDDLVLGELCERFLNAKRALIGSAELSPRTFGQYHATCRKLVVQFGKHRRVDDLASDDFERLRAEVGKTCGMVGIANEVRVTRMVFKYGYDAGLITPPIRFGPTFKVKAGTIRKAAAGRPPRMFEADEIRKLLAKADDIMKAMILLGINCAFGQTDLSDIPQSAIDLEGGWATFPRVKTGVERRAALWPETVAVIRKAIALRPEPKDEADADCLFLTSHRNRLVRCTAKYGHRDAVGYAFGPLLVDLKLKRPGLQFYALRHTFRTVADATRDFPAIDRIMGHSDATMGGRYRERIDDSRLKAVSDFVRSWLFAAKGRAR